ncbi:MAG: 4Fe-4S binding protein [Clostridia bacterium]
MGKAVVYYFSGTGNSLVIARDIARKINGELIPFEKQQKMFKDWEKKLESVSQFVNTRKEGIPETSARVIEHLVDFLNLRETLQKAAWLKIAGFEGHTDLPFQESIQLMDHGFNCDDKCINCNICSKVCPVKNIKMVEGRPVWQHQCEQCFACVQWCQICFIMKTTYSLSNKEFLK